MFYWYGTTLNEQTFEPLPFLFYLVFKKIVFKFCDAFQSGDDFNPVCVPNPLRFLPLNYSQFNC